MTTEKSEKVQHTCNVTYGSYYQEGVKVVCDANDDLDIVKAKIKKLLNLNFLAMATYQVKITNTERF